MLTEADMRARPSKPVPFAALMALLALTLALGACGGDDGDADAGATATVTSGPRTTEISGNDFESPIKVTAGSEVTWVNKDGVAHNVIGDEDSFRSETLNEDDTFTYTFSTPGRFEYVCTFHPGMEGVVEVQ
jgi:plastocyanin